MDRARPLPGARLGSTRGAGLRAARSPRVWLFCLAFLGAGLAAGGQQDQGPAPQPAEKQYSKAVIIEFEGMITPIIENFVYRKLDTAKARGADLVILRIDSPGGLVEPSIRTAERLRDVEWARTVAYVPREAISGAAIVSLGCNEIVMEPGATIGDAGPIVQGEDSLFRHAPEKVVSYLRGKVRGLAESQGHPALLAEAMVDKDLEVYRVENKKTGEKRFVTEDGYEKLTRDDEWQGELVDESEEGLFFTVTGRRAAELGFADATVEDLEGLKARYGLDEDPVLLEQTGLDTAVFILNLPLVTGLLFVIGLIALYVELSAPGIGIGGLVAGLCFALFFWSRFLGGTAGWLEVVLFVAGVAFLGVEIFLLPGFGVAGLSGILLLIVSLVLAMQDFVFPETGRELTIMTRTLGVILGSGLVTGIAAYLLSLYFGSLPILNRLTLHPPDAAEVAAREKPTGAAADAIAGRDVELKVGDTGMAESLLRPAGRARFGNRWVNVVADGDYIPKGRRVRIVEVAGNRVVVVPAESSTESSDTA